MTFPVKDWRDLPEETTPIDAAALEDVEGRLAGYAETVANTAKDFANVYTDDEVTAARAYTDTEVAGAKAYTDAEVTDAEAYTDAEVTDAKTYTDTEVTEGVADAKAYTDAKIAALPSTAVAAWDNTVAYAAGAFVRHNNRLWLAPAALPAGRVPRDTWTTVAGVPVKQTLGLNRALIATLTDDLSNWSAGGFKARGFRVEVTTACTLELLGLVMDGGSGFTAWLREYQADGTTFVGQISSASGTPKTLAVAPGVRYFLYDTNGTTGAVPATRQEMVGGRLRIYGGAVVEQWEAV